MAIRIETKNPIIFSQLNQFNSTGKAVLPDNLYSHRIINNFNRTRENVDFVVHNGKIVLVKKSDFKFNIYKG